MTDLGHLGAFDEVWKEVMPVPPARTRVATSGLLFRDAPIEIDLIAAMP